MQNLDSEIIAIRHQWDNKLISDAKFMEYIEYYRKLAFKDSRSPTGSCFINLGFIDTLKHPTGVDLPTLTSEGLNVEVKESRSANMFTLEPKEYEVSDYILLYSHVFKEFYLVETKKLAEINTERIKRGFRIPQLKRLGTTIPKNLIKLIEFIRKIRTEGI